MNESLVIDGFGPLPVCRPASVDELRSLVKEAAAKKSGLYPVGGRTLLEVGLPPIKPGIAVDATALDRVIDYPARDMTITVQAGITLARLQETLAAEGQWLPVDVPNPEQAALGGAVALNVSGPHRFGHGTFRDYVIGISFVTDEGDEAKAGGRVVKNVAGYDLMKLHVGAVGTLGIITQLTLKVKPRPEAVTVVSMRCPAAHLAGLLDALHASPSRPVVVDIAKAEREWNVWAAFEEKAVTVEWQTATLLAELQKKKVKDLTLEGGGAARERMRSLTRATAPEASFVFKANLRPSRVAEFCSVANEFPDLRLHVHALNGIAIGSWPGVNFEEAAAAVERLRQACEPDGNLVIRRCPVEWKHRLAVWGKPGPDRELMRHIKRTLDPNNLFNPGRLFGDL